MNLLISISKALLPSSVSILIELIMMVYKYRGYIERMGWVERLDPSLGMLFPCRTLHYRIVYPMLQVSGNQSFLLIIMYKDTV